MHGAYVKHMYEGLVAGVGTSIMHMVDLHVTRAVYSCKYNVGQPLLQHISRLISIHPVEDLLKRLSGLNSLRLLAFICYMRFSLNSFNLWGDWIFPTPLNCGCYSSLNCSLSGIINLMNCLGFTLEISIFPWRKQFNILSSLSCFSFF